ncbi:M20 metallopeptidase family protein [Allofustis seminis]|uniref:M20 metallopeptidase family protein n=1 Tax=Allofustis seminis TaxID=166939 RepID=UPI000367805F|nr:M20/M25/M40 family metallo-hydrolase [Allofustis seminis]
MDDFRKLRHELRAHPEISEHEQNTRKRLMSFLNKRLENTEIIDCGRYFYAVKREEDATETIAFRADHDAILNEEGQPFHGCGHDGHSTMLAGAAVTLDKKTIGKNIVYIFQHAEENGVGAKECVEILEKEHVDRVYGLHNWPGFSIGECVTRKGTFYCASRGLTIRLKGKQSHASMPEEGLNPVYTFAKICKILEPLAQFKGFVPTPFLNEVFSGLVLCTVVHLNVGEADAFGVNPGVGELSLTIRAEKLEDLDRLQEMILHLIKEEATGMAMTYAIHDDFPDTTNPEYLVETLREKMANQGITLKELSDPIRSSEDFGWYLKHRPGCFFILGAGEEHVPVHHPDYEFPDALIELGIKFWTWLAFNG